jgi:hypothetical protein
MKAFAHPLTTGVLGRPQDWDDALHGPCVGLPVCREQYSDGMVIHLSWHKLDWKDRIKALFGVPVRLGIVGNQHPVISLEFQRN